ncbi:PEP-CTERM/exosortase system-associated acyltransferase [Methylobacter svalbardensis]|uniref:PEP-CTERM/exosortase system-associated acyltransferase n=1 Tax=Methylobacter svalbardensis TaxID=3080016 RepID=UPI0030EB4393
MANNIIDAFNEYFEMVPAISDELKHEVYKLRYQVFCIENEVFNSEHYPDDLEFDDYDRRSVHYLIRHRKSGEYAATTRLILPAANNPEKLFPLELHCEIDNFAVLQPINRKHLGEVSRFGVSKAFKKRKNEAHTLAVIASDQQDHFTLAERRTFSYIALALMACHIKACYENDIHYLYAGAELSLLRFVSALGIHFTRIGPLADFHGKRWPSVIKITDLLDGVAEKNLDIWNLLTNKGCYLQAGSIVEKQNHLFGTIRKL